MKAHEQAVFSFGSFTLVPSERLLLRRREVVALTGRAFDLLTALVQSAGHLLTKDELLARVWPGVVVEEVNLSVNISALRKVLSQDTGGGDWIETVPRQGYRFNAPVEVGDAATLNLAELRGLPSAYRSEPASEAAASPARRRFAPVGLTVAALLLLVAAFGAYRWLSPAPPFSSVAVLPFTADSSSDAYLADGLSEAVIHGLTQVRNLRVAPRASAFRFKGAAADPAEAARKLGTDTIVTGALARDGGSVKLRVELVDVARNAQVWSAAYDVPAADLPRLQSRVMHDIAAALRVELTAAESSALAKQPTASVEAYQAYLEGRFHWNQRSEAAMQRAVERFQRAVQLDPGFALAYAALADAHTTRGYLGYVPPAATFPVARPYALKALELDPSLAQAHAALAYIKFYFDWDWAGAREEFRKAIALDPADPTAHQWNAVYLLAAGRPEEAFREVQAAHKLDPLSLAINTDIGFHHYYTGRYPEALAQLESVLEMKSDFMLAHLWLARTYLEMGRLDDALAATAFAEQGAREWPVLVAARGYTLAVAGRKEEARAVLREMEALSKTRFVTAYGVALVHAGLNQKGEAFRWLEKAFEERSHWLVWLRLDPRWNNLRGDPGFAEMVARMKYPAG